MKHCESRNAIGSVSRFLNGQGGAYFFNSKTKSKMEDTPTIYKVEVLDTPEVTVLKRKIKNEIDSYNLSPVISDKVTRISVIKEVPYKAVLEYAKSEGLKEPNLSYGKYSIWLHPNELFSVSIESVEVKTKTIIAED
jgi:hypothetical protein